MISTPLRLELSPVLTPPAHTTWPGSVWIGEVWRDRVEALHHDSETTGQPVCCRLNNADGYGRARLLVRSPGRIHGFIDLEISNGELDFADLAQHVARAVDAGSAEDSARRSRTVTVVICTRDRPQLLATALDAVLALDYPDFDVVVVDNASATSETRDHVQGHADPRVRLVCEPNPGVARARNTGLRAATGDIVAFVDDDAVVDRYWLTALMAGFDRAGSVGCVRAGACRRDPHPGAGRVRTTGELVDRVCCPGVRLELPAPGRPALPVRSGGVRHRSQLRARPRDRAAARRIRPAPRRWGTHLWW